MIFHALALATALVAPNLVLATTAEKTEEKAQSQSEALFEQAPAALKKLLATHDSIDKRFNVSSNLTGWVVKKDGRELVLYTVAPENQVVVGSLYDDQGEDLTVAYIKQYTSRFDEAPPALLPDDARSNLWSALESTWFVQSPAAKEANSDDALAKTVYVLADMQCIYCHLLWQMSHNVMQEGFDMRWIPVAVLSPASWQQATALMQHDKPYTLLDQLMRSKVAKVQIDQDKAQQTDQALHANNALMQQYGLMGTPALVWKDDQGQVQVAQGIPPPKELEKIVGKGLGTMPPDVKQKIASLYKKEQ